MSEGIRTPPLTRGVLVQDLGTPLSTTGPELIDYQKRYAIARKLIS